MKLSHERDRSIKNLFNSNKIATIDEVKAIAGSTSTMTIYRALSRLGYLSSYSHRGRFYTLPEIPDFNQNGIWSCRSVMFSQHGNLLETAALIVQRSDEGFIASELESLLQVEVKHVLLRLLQRKKISRSKLETGWTLRVFLRRFWGTSQSDPIAHRAYSRKSGRERSPG